MVLLDEVTEADDDGLSARLDIRQGLPFFTGEGIPTYVGIEYIAQAISAFNGYRAKQRGEDIRIGFLLGTRKLDFARSWFAEGERLDVRVVPVFDDEGMAVFDGSIAVGGEEIVTARVNVYQPDEPLQMIEEVKRDV